MRIRRNKFNRQLYQPPLKKVIYYDLGVFIFVFFMCLMANFTERSVEFNLVVSLAFLLKCLIGAQFRMINSFQALRKLIVIRLLADCFCILPIIIYYRYFSFTYTYNYVIIIFCLCISELILILKHVIYLYSKSMVECIEELQASQKVDFISHFNTKSKSVVAYINTFKAAKYLNNTLGYQYNPSEVPKYTYSRP